jgi:hypothetical protein
MTTAVLLLSAAPIVAAALAALAAPAVWLHHRRGRTVAARAAADYRPPYTWPENTEPTPEQALRWLLAAGHDVQVAKVGQWLDDTHAVTRCFTANHDGLAEEVGRAADRVRLARAEVAEAREATERHSRALVDALAAQYDAEQARDVARGALASVREEAAEHYADRLAAEAVVADLKEGRESLIAEAAAQRAEDRAEREALAAEVAEVTQRAYAALRNAEDERDRAVADLAERLAGERT